VAWNAHLLAVAQGRPAGPAEVTELLELANRVYPWNDAAHFELGRALFKQATATLGDPGPRDAALLRSAEAFRTALRLNPGAAAVHFEYAQTLLYMDYLSLPVPAPAFEQYKKAAALTGHNSQIFFEVGRVLLSRWPSLSQEEKDFTVDILGRAMAGKSEERFTALVEAWRLSGGEPSVIDRIMPEDPSLLRAYARFLGERAIFPDARLTALARAEHLEFLRAKNDLLRGQRALDYFQGDEGTALLRSCLRSLDSLRFYQALAGLDLIDRDEFRTVRLTALRALVEDRLERTGSLDDPDGALARYLELEDRLQALGDLESLLKDRGLLGEAGGPAARAGDLRALAFRMTLDFKQNRYRDIVRTGEMLSSSFLVIPGSGRASYVRVLVLLGESCLKLDYVYEAEEYFRQALEIAPEDLEALLGMERCYERLNDGPKAAGTRLRIEGLLSPARLELDGRPIEKGGARTIELVLDGRPRVFRVEFDPLQAGARPLAAVLFNGLVVREGFPEDGALEFTASSRVGPNSLEILAVGAALRPVVLMQRTPEGL
jgi:tetratricopeptide (TPR) repeat protein